MIHWFFAFVHKDRWECIEVLSFMHQVELLIACILRFIWPILEIGQLAKQMLLRVWLQPLPQPFLFSLTLPLIAELISSPHWRLSFLRSWRSLSCRLDPQFQGYLPSVWVRLKRCCPLLWMQSWHIRDWPSVFLRKSWWFFILFVYFISFSWWRVYGWVHRSFRLACRWSTATVSACFLTHQLFCSNSFIIFQMLLCFPSDPIPKC